MNGADLSFAKLTCAKLLKVQAKNATFLQTDLTGADFAGANLDGSIFSQAILFKTNFTGTSLRGVHFSQSDVSVATFDAADVEGTDFTHAVGFSEDLLGAARNGDKALLPRTYSASTTLLTEKAGFEENSLKKFCEGNYLSRIAHRSEP